MDNQYIYYDKLRSEYVKADVIKLFEHDKNYLNTIEHLNNYTKRINNKRYSLVPFEKNDTIIKEFDTSVRNESFLFKLLNPFKTPLSTLGVFLFPTGLVLYYIGIWGLETIYMLGLTSLFLSLILIPIFNLFVFCLKIYQPKAILVILTIDQTNNTIKEVVRTANPQFLKKTTLFTGTQ